MLALSFVGALVLLVSPAPSFSDEPDASVVDQGVATIRSSLDNNLPDYPGTRFRGVRGYVRSAEVRRDEFEDRLTVCGEMNPVNRVGGFAGWRRFVYIGGAEPFALTSTPHMVEMHCGQDKAFLKEDLTARITYSASQ